jgi:hypothetical protein
MSKIETILGLLLFLLILFSMNMIFANPLKEIFSNNVSNNVSISKGIETKQKKNNKISGNIIYSGSGFLDETVSYPKGDDQPLFFGFNQK